MQLVEYSTSDFSEAVVLRYFDHKINRMEKDGRRCVFYFEGRSDTDEIMKKYKSRELEVEPFKFSLSVKDVKDRIFNG